MMLRMTDIPENQKRKLSPEVEAIRREEQPSKTILRMADLPQRGRTKPTLQERDADKPTKILTLSDLPKRATIAKHMAVEARRAQAVNQRKFQERLLGPKVFSEFVKNGAWKGRRCFIIGGGPSVKKLDLGLLRGEMTIGINRAYELLDPSILFGVDGQMWGWVEQGKLGEESKRKFNAYRGYKVWMALHRVFPPDFYLIDVDGDGGYKIGTTGRLAFKNNSGYGAINLAAALGANPIYLLGFDMHGDKQGKQKWWHDGYPVDYGENVYKRYIEEIGQFAPVLKDAGFKVVNLNPKSALKCFEFGNYQEVAKQKPRIPVTSIQVMEKPGMVTAITPTGDRPLAFALCKHWMEMQTVRPDQWIVVDDGKTPTKAPAWADYIRRAPQHNDPKHTLNINIRTAIPHIKGSKIIIIEDDEYYAPKYVETMERHLGKYEVVGISRAKYYHLPSGGYTQIGNVTHASLAQTGFRNSALQDINKLAADNNLLYLDMKLWQEIMPTGRGFIFSDDLDGGLLYVGMKGLPGRPGIGAGHSAALYGGNKDNNRSWLRKWVPRDYQVYLDILSGKLNNANCNTYFPQITGITVCQNTKEFMEKSYTSVRKFHPNMPIIIIDGSDANDPCAAYVKSLESELTTVFSLGYNIGHGRGMCMGIDKAKTPYALIFDSDIEMLKSPVQAMLDLMEPDTFGVGYPEKIGLDGYGYGSKPHHKGQPWRIMLHPYFHLINIANYRKYHPYVHHGAPCYLTARDIHDKGLSDKILKVFPGLDHPTAEPREYIKHKVGGTGRLRIRKGQIHIEGSWDIE